MKLPVISLAILVGQVAAAVAADSRPLGAVNAFQSFYTGINFYNGQFLPQRLLVGYAPWIVKRFVGAIARPRMPLHGLPISLS